MPEARKRKWLQIHLSTCIILMFVAAGLLWANMRERDYPNAPLPLFYNALPASENGWPFIAVRTYAASPLLGEREILYRYVVFDGVCALAILFAVAFACEWSIRRRERQP